MSRFSALLYRLVRIDEIAKTRNSTSCQVTNIQSGQLALRSTPDGNPFAGLDNGDSVFLQKKPSNWDYVYVVRANNPGVNSLKGWVNSSYLTCQSQ